MTARKTAPRKYSPDVSKQVGTELHEMKQGRLKSGNSDKKVTNPKQAIAIALSEARRAGKKVPPPPKPVAKKTAVKKAAGKKTAAKKPRTKKAASKKSAAS